MKSSRAVEIASTWVQQEAASLPGFHGAHLSGSLNQLSSEDELPDYSDIDIYCVMDEEYCFPQKKFRYNGALLETVSYPVAKYASSDAVLANPFLAHTFLNDPILADPNGLLDNIYRRVKEDFAQLEWLQARYEKLKTMILGVLDGTGEAKSLDAAFPNLFRSLRLLSNLILVSQLQAPTVRKSINNARRTLVRMGQVDMADDLLELLGSDHLSVEEVHSSLNECVKAFDRAAEVRRTPSPADFNLDLSARPYLIEGSEEMIHAGEHREAMLWIAVMHWTAHGALLNDAPVEEQSKWQASIDNLYSKLGLHNMADSVQRMELAQEVAAKVMHLTDQIVHRSAS